MVIPNEMSDLKILEALRAGGAMRQLAWEYMYKKWRGIWLSKIKAVGGTPDEAAEALSETWNSFQRTVTRPGFELKSAKLSTYLTKCIYNRWSYNAKRRPETEEFTDQHLQDFVESVEHGITKQECRALIDSLLSILGERCKKILTMHSERYNMSEIAIEMGFEGGAETAKKEKYKCARKMEEYLQIHSGLRAQLSDCYNYG